MTAPCKLTVWNDYSRDNPFEYVFDDVGELRAFERSSKPRKQWAPVPAAFVVVRRRELIHDLFLPTFFNHAMRVDQIALKILAIVGALLLDLVTFPFRLISLVPRIIWNRIHSRGQHPLYKLLKENGAPAEMLKRESYLVRFEWEGKMTNPPRINYRERWVNVEECPTSPNSDDDHEWHEEKK